MRSYSCFYRSIDKELREWSESLGVDVGSDAGGLASGDADVVFGDGVGDIRPSKKKRKELRRLVYHATAKLPPK